MFGTFSESDVCEVSNIFLNFPDFIWTVHSVNKAKWMNEQNQFTNTFLNKVDRIKSKSWKNVLRTWLKFMSCKILVPRRCRNEQTALLMIGLQRSARILQANNTELLNWIWCQSNSNNKVCIKILKFTFLTTFRTKCSFIQSYRAIKRYK